MRIFLLSLCVFGLLFVHPAAAAEYDPLEVSAPDQTKILDLTVPDAARKREIPIKVYLPAADKPAPVLLFSHGLGGTRAGCAYLGKHWSARGYAAVFVQHPGSDDSVWKDQPVRERMAAMQRAASLQNLLLRVRDVPAVLDQLDQWNKEAGHPLAARFDMLRVGMSGHSFGAVTTQAVSGQANALARGSFGDARIKAAIAFSPSSPRRGDAKQAFRKVSVPWLLMTGTKDSAPIGGQTVESRLAVYPSLPATIEKYELVLHNAEHSAFSDRALPGDKVARNANHHRAILALSTAFWDTHLRQDPAARAWLHDEAKVRGMLEPQDRWQRNTRR